MITQLELEGKIGTGDESLNSVDRLIMIQCVGCRNEDRNYCSRVCCSGAMKNALKMRALRPKAEIYVLFRDMRTYGFKEDYYREAANKGVQFIRYEPSDKPTVEAIEEGGRDYIRVTATHPAPTDAFNTRQLWAAVSVLGVAVVALGASLVYLQARPVDGHTAAAALSAPALVAPADDAATSPLPVTTVGPGEAIVPASEPAPVAAKPVKPAAVHKPGPPGASATKTTAASPAATTAVPAATMVPAAVVTGTVPNAPMVVTDAGLIASQPIAPAPRVACANCGRVESVTPIERRGEAKGVGAVTGGVLGAVVGNQIGKGNGRALATVLGAVGGGLA